MVAAPNYYWPCDDGTGTTCDEKIVGASADGAMGADLAWDTQTVGTQTGRNVLKGLTAGSANSYLDATITAASDTDWTVQIWVGFGPTYPQQSDTHFFSTGTGASGPIGNLYLNAHPWYPTYYVNYFAMNGFVYAGSGVDVNTRTNTWSHLLYTQSGGTLVCYINGSSIGALPSATQRNMPSGSTTLTFGNLNPHALTAALPTRQHPAGGGALTPEAWYAEGALWLGTALSSADATTLYNSGTPYDLSPAPPPAAAARRKTAWFF